MKQREGGGSVRRDSTPLGRGQHILAAMLEPVARPKNAIIWPVDVLDEEIDMLLFVIGKHRDHPSTGSGTGVFAGTANLAKFAI